MKIIGIIAEYNPFHNGHAYQIKKIKENLQADYVVVAMSGNFVQRGAPAIIDKYARTEMALSCGADLVIELPVLWATASAEAFAMAGVTLFDKMGCVDGICFGAETDDISTLTMLSSILVEEPDAYRTMLSSYLKEGMAFPAARSIALCDYVTMFPSTNPMNDFTKNNSVPLDYISTILNEPNNILAIEYLKALKRRNSRITPHVIKRQGAGYHDKTIAISNDNIITASATAIRNVLDTTFIKLEDSLSTAMPTTALDVLNNYITTHAFVSSTDFSSILGYKLLTSSTSTLAEIGDSNTDIANRFFKNRMFFSSFEQFCELNKSKDVTYTRICRILLHLILNIHNEDYQIGKDVDYIPYLRILGFCKESAPLLKELKNTSQVPIISKLADASSYLNEQALFLLEKDIFAADLYSQICANKISQFASSEYTKPIIRL